MSQHTKGPWSVHTESSGKWLIRGDGTRLVLAYLNSEADAHLIAAAPDLLRALQGMCSLWQTVCDSKGWSPEHVKQYTDASAVIDRATGRNA